jgi:hypothetical protein
MAGGPDGSRGIVGGQVSNRLESCDTRSLYSQIKDGESSVPGYFDASASGGC